MADVIVAGGTESMSNMPLLFTKEFSDKFGKFAMAKTIGARISALRSIHLRDLKPRIAIVEGLTDPFVGINMGQTAEILAKEFHVTREDQDQFAVRSHTLAVTAQKNGILDQEITPVFLAPQYKEIVAQDVGPREGQSLEQLAKLKPYFD